MQGGCFWGLNPRWCLHSHNCSAMAWILLAVPRESASGGQNWWGENQQMLWT